MTRLVCRYTGSSPHPTFGPFNSYYGLYLSSIFTLLVESLFTYRASLIPAYRINSNISSIFHGLFIHCHYHVCCKVIIKQEPGEASHVPTTGAASQSPLPQYVTVKGGHMIAVSPQKQVLTAGEGTAQSPKIQPSKVCVG